MIGNSVSWEMWLIIGEVLSLNHTEKANGMMEMVQCHLFKLQMYLMK